MIKKIFLTGAVILGIIGLLLSGIFVGSAIAFHEWGRVLVYGVAAVVSLEISILSWLKLKNKEDT